MNRIVDFKFSEDKSRFWHNIFPFGKFTDPRYGEVEITKELCEEIVSNFKRGIPHYEPPLLISHNEELGAYGKIVNLEVREDGLWAEIELTDEGKKLIENEKFRYLSIGYVEDYLSKDGENVGAVLIEVSLTNTPAHPDVDEIKLSEEYSEYVEIFSEYLESMKKFYIPPVSNTPKVESTSWNWDWARDANAIIDKLGWAGLARACAYVDVKNYEKGESGWPENKAAYKLPHHKLVNGKLTLDRAGVIAAMGALLGARGGVNIPREDKRRVYNHLARHYRAFDMEPPEFHYDEEVNVKVEEKDVKVFEERIKTLEEENENLKKQLSEYEERIKQLEEKLFAEQVEKWRDEWVRKGVPPAVVDKFKELVDTSEALKKYDEILSELAKPEMFKKFGSENANVSESVIAEKIVSAIYGGGEK